jgi:hypothetical protein
MSLMARAGARGLSVLARVGEKLAIGLRAAGKAVKAVITNVGSKIAGWVGRGEKEISDIGIVGEKASSSTLRANLEAAKVHGLPGFDAHHIVPGGDSRSALSQAILDKFRIGINSAENGVFLPGSKAIAGNPFLNPGGVIRHGLTFSDAYHLRVYELLKDVRSQQEVLDTLDSIRSSLLSGRLP